MKNLFIQEGFLVQSKSKNPSYFTKLFSLNDWLKKSLTAYQVSYQDPCCIDVTSVIYHETVDANTALSLDKKITYIATTAARAYTLADGIDGQEKIIKMTVDGGDGVVTVAHLAGGTTLTFNDAGDTVKLQFVGGVWYPIYNSGATLA